MYCSSCGAEAVQGFQYCKRCGANLSPAESLASTRRSKGLVWIVAFGIAMMMGMPMGGIAVVFERIPGLLELGFPLWFLMALAIICLLMTTAATVLLSRLLSPIFKTYLQASEPTPIRKPTLSEAAAIPISASRDSMVSITEETTRTFEQGARSTEH